MISSYIFLCYVCIFTTEYIRYNNNSIILFVFLLLLFMLCTRACVYYESMYERRKCATSFDLSLTWVKHTVMQGLCELQRSVVSCFMALLPAGGQPFTIFCPAPWFTAPARWIYEADVATLVRVAFLHDPLFRATALCLIRITSFYERPSKADIRRQCWLLIRSLMKFSRMCLSEISETKVV